MQVEDSLCKRCGAELRKDRALLKQRQISQNDHDLPAWSNMENAVSSGNSSDDSVSTNFTTASTSWDELHSCGSSPLFESHIVKTPENVESCLPNMLEFDGQEAFPLTRVEYQLARLTIQYHALVENYNNSLYRLQQAEANVDNLRKENLELQASNMELAKIFDMRERHIQRLTFNSLPSLNNNVQIPLDSCSLLPSRPFNSNHIGCPNLVSSSGVSSGMCGNEPSSNNEFSAHGLSSGLSIVSCQAENNPMLKPKCKMNNSTADNSPTSVLSFEDNTHEIVNTNLFPKTAPSPQADSGLDHRLVNTKPPAQQHPVLPKSISIRSAGFLNMKVTNTPRSDQQKGTLKLPPQKLLLSKPVPVPSSNRPGHRLRLPATKETAPDACISTDQPMDKAKSNMVAELEYDVYSQGMFKTELCNKWQDTGTCPYGDRCQFAHGIEELRPVIRHPRYKTELCRMVAAGDKCPYGHRCHFRHSLSKEEKATLL